MILITGADGQLGTALRQLIPQCLAPSSSVLDISDPDSVEAYFSVHKPEVVINCAAYNFVDLAESNADECFQVNAEGSLNIAKECMKYSGYMIHISSDYVFDGKKSGSYEVTDEPSPISVYGRSKAEGERNVLGVSSKYAVVRTSWLFSELQNNFVSAIIRAASAKVSIDVVEDQIGSPTYASDLAALICKMAERRSTGLFQATNEGFCSRADFAEEILKQADIDCIVNRIPSTSYPSAAARPANSCMSKESLIRAGLPLLPEWQEALRRCLSNRNAQHNI